MADNLLGEKGPNSDVETHLPLAPIADNRLTHWQKLFYRYDAWGNLVSRRNGIYEQHYRYDADNRLIQARGRGPQGEFDAQYHYDALGRRSRKVVQHKGKAAQTTRFLWQGYRLLQEQRADGSRRSWSYDPASPWSPLAALEQAGDSRSAEIYWYHTDLNSAPLEVTDAAGNLCWSGQYDTFGKLQGQTVAGAARRNGAQYDQPLRYAGQYQDNESGLHYNLFRYYEPEVGRFTTQDPIGLRGGLNLYRYAPNPLGWIDPLGLSGLNSLQQQIDEILLEHLPAIQKIDPNATVGYRGSAASGISKSHDPAIARPINMNDFDVDGFIKSDYLASSPEFRNRRRDASKLGGMKSIEESIDSKLRQKFPGLRNEPFGFRVFYTHELDDLARKGDVQRRLGRSGCS
ncbi:Cell wall-associated polypeptide CWBP200 [Serratia entomophila]|nr:Cell wall-associated polypeptide CWBP200 [Serratia entomophila]CAI0847066.1 Cell wall-associated polypeptide CWBP200 [Serratia entomophila]CAI0859903.1 Cell wall-associated polypeptide CWBP200 [Serratia entomophila]CAI0885312.1 Cell wall-associated polypeptide CWBP200 [Serratia entomophila]CAI0889357.1 Cell wall-associated polypeptide CWBP200 [Serratia entomophila]